MIIVDVKGGLGNQLFHYSIAKALALTKNTDFMLNIDSYKGEDAKLFDHVEFKLNHFNIGDYKTITTDEINKLYDVDVIIEPLSSTNFVDYIDFSNINKDMRLIGFWQDERYFKRYENIIKNDLKVVTPPNKKNRMMLSEINETNSVCLSFRRGEYLDSYYLSHFGMCTETYYKNAINFMSKRVENPVFYIFSDDVEWIEDNVKLDFPTIPVNINGIGNEHEELRLMNHCDHFILANSSFSWWGAWLSKNKHKQIFAPKPWFNSYTKENILCKNWIHLKCDRSDLFDKSSKKIFEFSNDFDLKELQFQNMEKNIDGWGYELKTIDSTSNFKFKFDNDLLLDNDEYIIQFNIFSKKDGLFKIDYGETRQIILGYSKGDSVKYLHIKDIKLNDLVINISDDSLIIRNIAIKSVNSDFTLIYDDSCG